MKAVWKQTIRLTVLSLALSASLGVTQAQTVVNVAYGLPRDTFFGDFAEAFKVELERLSAGKFVVEPIPSYLGGNDRAAIESVQLGTIQMSLTSTAVAESFVTGTAVLDLPYIIRDVEHARIIQEGPIGEELLARYEAGGLVGVALGGADFRNVTTSSVPVRKASDLVGMKMRTMQSEVHLLAFKAMGTLPTPIAFPELYTALQTGTVDGEENPVSVVRTARLYEVQKHMSMTKHVFNNTVMLTSPEFWQTLSAEEQTWFRAAGKKGAAAQRERILGDERRFLDEMVAAGLDVIEDVDLDSFRAAVEPAYATYEQMFGKDLIARIRSAR